MIIDDVRDMTLEELLTEQDHMMHHVIQFDEYRMSVVQTEIIQRLGVRELTRRENESRRKTDEEKDELWKFAYNELVQPSE